MSSDPFEKVVCPGCGWIGSPKSLHIGKTCPKCTYEGCTTLRKMFDDSLDWNGVHMPEFFWALQKLGALSDSAIAKIKHANKVTRAD
jgi:ammonia channel protein AmtB